MTDTILPGVVENPEIPGDRVFDRDKSPIAAQIMNEVLHPQVVE
jgi:hypothetical protein